MPVNYVTIQISGSGAINEPNNSVTLLPTDLTFAKSSRTNVIRAPASDGGTVFYGGSDNRSFQGSYILLGDYASMTTKRSALENIIRHTSSASYRGRPSTFSIYLNSTLSEQHIVMLEDYRLQQRRGRKKIWDVDLRMIQYTE